MGAPTVVFDESSSLTNGSRFPLKKETVGAPVSITYLSTKVYCFINTFDTSFFIN